MRAAVDQSVVGALEINPFGDRVAGLVGGVPFGALCVDRDPGQRGVLAAVVEVQMAVDDRGDLLDRHAGLRQRRHQRPRRCLVFGKVGMCFADTRVEEQPATIGLDRIDDHDTALAGKRPVRPYKRRDLDRHDAHARHFAGQ